ncbi:lysostaphin resistance A-like protein [Salinimicrobium sp. GXAS 041]|uniref:CPBP family intramembrane glutamic endopeptidase n=1 Tax=Salinimicrobium sp. GXAS 041 TaxID=3400806 RepID=UPI003C78FC88
MAGILVALILSWLLLYLFEGENILSLGFLPILKRLLQLAIGFIITAVLCASVEYLELLLSASDLQINKNANLALLFNMFWWDFQSVLTEELIFRGALLFILIRRIGATKGMLISAVAFGIYHWFSFGIFGNIFPMLIVFIGTGLMGYAWALAFRKTGSIFLPLGLHLGWNFTFNTIFSQGPLGRGLLSMENGHGISDWFSLVGLWLVPLIVFLIIKYFIKQETTEFIKAEINPSAPFS